MPTIAIHAPELSGESGLTLELWTLAGVLTNTGGDSLTESPASSGRFVATVAETISETHHARVKDSLSVVVRDGWLPRGATIVQDAYTMRAEDRLGYLLSVEVGAISNAQEDDEAYSLQIDGVTFNTTLAGLDENGNRTSVSMSQS